MAGNSSVVVLTVGWIWGFGFAPADISREIATALSTCMCLRRSGRGHLCINGGGGFYWPCLADEMANLAVAAMAPIGAVFTFIAWLPALHGENRCGAPGGYGMQPDF